MTPLPPPGNALVLRLPDPWPAPVVFDSPHSGLQYPPGFEPAASAAAIRTTWDAYVDELAAGVVGAGAALLAARFPRACIDANRAANDIDPEVLAEPWPGDVVLSEHSSRGMGLIRRFALPGVPMYREKLPVAEVQRRLDRLYFPYRRTLRHLIDTAHARCGEVWHFDLHSMKSRGNAMNRDQGAARPDFVIGDRLGTSAPAALTARVAAFFETRGFVVRINDPYRGADIVRAEGAPARGRHSIQIEINRGLYMDEATCERSAGFGRVREALTALAETFVARPPVLAETSRRA